MNHAKLQLLFLVMFLHSISFSQIDSTIVQPTIIKNSTPVYPTEARRNNISGIIWLKILVDTMGIPKQVIVSKSDNTIFNEPSILAAKQILFSPATKNGKVIESWITLPYRFFLNQSNGQQLKR